MKIKDELQAIYEEQEEVYYCCYCLEPQGEKITCCFENHMSMKACLRGHITQHLTSMIYPFCLA